MRPSKRSILKQRVFQKNSELKYKAIYRLKNLRLKSKRSKIQTMCELLRLWNEFEPPVFNTLQLLPLWHGSRCACPSSRRWRWNLTRRRRRCRRSATSAAVDVVVVVAAAGDQFSKWSFNLLFYFFFFVGALPMTNLDSRELSETKSWLDCIILRKHFQFLSVHLHFICASEHHGT